MFKKNKKKIITLMILFILTTLSSVYLLYALSLLVGIENKIRLVLGIIIILLWIGFTLGYFKSIKKKKSKYYIYIPIASIYIIILFVFGYFIIKTYNVVDSMSNNKNMYYTSLVVLSSNKIEKIDQLNKGKIGILGDSTSIDGNQIPKEIIKSKKINNETEEYSSYIDLIKALYDKKIEAAFLPSAYTIMFQNFDGVNLEKIEEETKVIYEQKKEVKKKASSKTSLKDPFTILLMGVDSEKENIANSSFNGDSLILVTFNPTTLNTTMLSIPRDTYVPISCLSNQKSKITHAAGYGQDCMIKTIENYTKIKIDYYVKMNFKGVVKLVDTLGGVEVDVPYNFCEQNSSRQWGKNTVYVEKGLQTLSGEQALAFARNRHPWPQYCSKKWTNYESDDFIRGQHQQQILKSTLNKFKSIRNLDTIYKLLDTVSNNMETNMSTNEILSMYNIGKDIIAKSSGENVEDLIGFQKLSLSGKDATLYDSLTRSYIYNFLVYEDSLSDVTKAMKVNLGQEKREEIKEYSFNIEEPYEEKVIGKGNYSKVPSVGQVPDFVGDSEEQARKSAKNIGLNLTFKYVTSGTGKINTVISQNVKKGTGLDKINSIILTILKEEEKKVETKPEEKPEEKEETKPEEKPTEGEDEEIGNIPGLEIE